MDDATRERLVYSIGDRQAVLVELSLSTGATTADIREQFTDVFHAAFEQQAEQPPEPVPISANYMRCLLTQDEITKLADQDTGRPAASPPLSRTIYRIWPDYRVTAHIDRSVTTIKADAATRTYGTAGIGIVWAVIDSGIDKDHPHFAGGTLTDPAVAHLHRDFTGLLTGGATVSDDPAPALTDPVGHGTHVSRHHRRRGADGPEQASHRGERADQRRSAIVGQPDPRSRADPERDGAQSPPGQPQGARR